MTGEPVPTTYAALRHEIVQVFLEGKERARQAVEQEKLRTCWEVGDRLHQHLLQQRDRAEYGERVMARLAEDLGMLPQRLYEMLEFRRVFPIPRSSGKLTFTHYVKLLQVPKREVRERYLLRAEEAGWSVRELAEAIRAGAVQEAAPGALPEDASPEPAARFVPRRGQLYTYRLVQSAGGLKLDVGFGVRVAVDLGGLEDARVGLAVVSAKEQTGEGERYRFAADRTSRPKLYTYQARVGEVIDGDTLWAEIDCGFGVWVQQKLRLRGVDAPELSRPAGGQVRRFVAETLSQVEFVVLSTSRADKYDRYLADVFYRAGEQEPQGVLREGFCLNQELLDQGLVLPFRE